VSLNSSIEQLRPTLLFDEMTGTMRVPCVSRSPDQAVQHLNGSQNKILKSFVASRTIFVRFGTNWNRRTQANDRRYTLETLNVMHVSRIYGERRPDDGVRVLVDWLVDRFWPHDLRKDDAQSDNWLPDIAPSPPIPRIAMTTVMNSSAITRSFLSCYFCMNISKHDIADDCCRTLKNFRSLFNFGVNASC
jgi:hypothetical protein